ncbi:MAG: long-chain fatty acid--CoA ligase [Rhodospirillaceae bacterium]|nr:MAG: long-chain fatty acid--CoA ligase [Rhodospirillaceae bacterium]
MTAWDQFALDLRYEALFGDRVVLCRVGRPENLDVMLRDAARRAPMGEALVCGNIRLTWKALDDLVAETAAGLTVIGIRKADRVALLLGNSIEFVIALYAIARLGAIVVPLSTREQAPGIAYILNHSGAALLIYEQGLASRLPAETEMQAVRSRIAIETGEEAAPFRDIRSSAPQPSVEVCEEDVFAILYTSGTTGKPKGATVAHVNVVHAALIYEHTMALGEGERSIVAVPMTHITGISGMVAVMARCAGTLIIMRDFNAQDFLALAEVERMTHTVLVPAMYNLCLARADLKAYDLSAWRIGSYGGAPMSASTIEALAQLLPNLGLMNLYGSTETVVPQAIMPPRYALERRQYVGLAAPGGEVIVMDGAGRQLQPGQPGEIWMRNATVVRGYWNDPEATAENFVGGFWRSGDLGLVDENGFIRVLDRIKDMINRGGYKIYTAEVEAALAEHPAVLESAVVARPCPVLGERVHAFVALRATKIDSAELANFCKARLADYKCPESFTIGSEALPRNANGKLMKRELRATLLANSN